MKIPLVIWIAVWIQLLPLLVALRRPREIAGARVGVLLWLVTLLATDLVAWYWSNVLGRGNNLFISYAFLPLGGTAILWALAELQALPIARATVRLCIPIFWVWSLVSMLFFEDTDNFAQLSGPVLGLVALSATLFAFVTRLQVESRPVLRTDWCWLLLGLAIFFATNSTISILQAYLTARAEWDLLVRALVLKASVDIVAILSITGGVLWPSHPMSSGASSSPSRSP